MTLHGLNLGTSAWRMRTRGTCAPNCCAALRLRRCLRCALLALPAVLGGACDAFASSRAAARRICGAALLHAPASPRTSAPAPLALAGTRWRARQQRATRSITWRLAKAAAANRRWRREVCARSAAAARHQLAAAAARDILLSPVSIAAFLQRRAGAATASAGERYVGVLRRTSAYRRRRHHSSTWPESSNARMPGWRFDHAAAWQHRKTLPCCWRQHVFTKQRITAWQAYALCCRHLKNITMCCGWQQPAFAQRIRLDLASAADDLPAINQRQRVSCALLPSWRDTPLALRWFMADGRSSAARGAAAIGGGISACADAGRWRPCGGINIPVRHRRGFTLALCAAENTSPSFSLVLLQYPFCRLHLAARAGGSSVLLPLAPAYISARWHVARYGSSVLCSNLAAKQPATGCMAVQRSAASSAGIWRHLAWRSFVHWRCCVAA